MFVSNSLSLPAQASLVLFERMINILMRSLFRRLMINVNHNQQYATTLGISWFLAKKRILNNVEKGLVLYFLITNSECRYHHNSTIDNQLVSSYNEPKSGYQSHLWLCPCGYHKHPNVTVTFGATTNVHGCSMLATQPGLDIHSTSEKIHHFRPVSPCNMMEMRENGHGFTDL